MNENLQLALQITVIGMSLIFAALGLIWIVLAALVRLTADRLPAEAGTTQVERALKQRAAIVAVAAARAQAETPTPPRFPLPPTSSVSAWQAVMRGQQLKQRGPVR